MIKNQARFIFQIVGTCLIRQAKTLLAVEIPPYQKHVKTWMNILPIFRNRNRRYNAYTFEKAQSICEEKGGRLVEIHTKNELEYLTKYLSPKFWLGAKRNTDTGMWHWDSDGNEVNMGLWKDFPVREELSSRGSS